MRPRYAARSAECSGAWMLDRLGRRRPHRPRHHGRRPRRRLRRHGTRGASSSSPTRSRASACACGSPTTAEGRRSGAARRSRSWMPRRTAPARLAPGRHRRAARAAPGRRGLRPHRARAPAAAQARGAARRAAALRRHRRRRRRDRAGAARAARTPARCSPRRPPTAPAGARASACTSTPTAASGRSRRAATASSRSTTCRSRPPAVERAALELARRRARPHRPRAARRRPRARAPAPETPRARRPARLGGGARAPRRRRQGDPAREVVVERVGGASSASTPAGSGRCTASPRTRSTQLVAGEPARAAPGRPGDRSRRLAPRSLRRRRALRRDARRARRRRDARHLASSPTRGRPSTPARTSPSGSARAPRPRASTGGSRALGGRGIRRASASGSSRGVVVLDPPRSGAGREVVEGVADLEPADGRLRRLRSRRARARPRHLPRRAATSCVAVDAVDLFPNSHHIEAVATSSTRCRRRAR